MPADLLHVELESLPALGVDPRLLAGFEAYLARAPESLAILGPPAAGTRALLMVLARRVGAALRDENIHLRDRGGDLKAGRKKLCYLPGEILAEALRDPAAARTLRREAACFVQDDEAAFGSAELEPPVLLELIDARLSAGRPTFLSADPAGLSADLALGLRERMAVIEAAA